VHAWSERLLNDRASGRQLRADNLESSQKKQKKNGGGNGAGGWGVPDDALMTKQQENGCIPLGEQRAEVLLSGRSRK